MSLSGIGLGDAESLWMALGIQAGKACASEVGWDVGIGQPLQHVSADAFRRKLLPPLVLLLDYTSLVIQGHGDGLLAAW